MMTHRYATRSTTSTPVIDFTRPLPRIRTHSRTSQHSLNPTTSSNPSIRQRVAPEPVAEAYNNSVHTTSARTDRQVNVENVVTTVPCFNVSFSEIPDIITCHICLEPLSASREPMATRCGHIFCSKCLSIALKKRKFCPTCQSTVNFSKCIRVYF